MSLFRLNSCPLISNPWLNERAFSREKDPFRTAMLVHGLILIRWGVIILLGSTLCHYLLGFQWRVSRCSSRVSEALFNISLIWVLMYSQSGFLFSKCDFDTSTILPQGCPKGKHILSVSVAFFKPMRLVETGWTRCELWTWASFVKVHFFDIIMFLRLEGPFKLAEIRQAAKAVKLREVQLLLIEVCPARRFDRANIFQMLDFPIFAGGHDLLLEDN